MSEYIGRCLENLTDELNDSTDCIKALKAQVSALTEQRDALLAACKAALIWHQCEVAFGQLRPSVLDSVREQMNLLAAAIAQGEPKE